MHNFPRTWLPRLLCISASLFVAMAALSFSPTLALAEDVVTLLDGQEATGEVSNIFSDGAITGRDLPTGLTLESLVQLQRDAEIQTREFQGAEAYLVGQGGVLSATDLSVANDICILQDTIAGEISVKVERLGSLLLTEGAPAEVFLRAQTTPLRLSDVIFLNTEEGPRAIEALLESITPETVAFTWDGELREVPRQRIYGIVFAERQRDRTDSRCLVRFINGDDLAGSIVKLSDGTLTLQTPFSPELKLPFDQVARIEIDSPRLVYLSDIEPIDVEESPLLSLPSPWQRNLSVNGRPLQLGDRQFAHGIGVHAASRLTFPVESQFETFHAIVGIDAETEGHGDCVVVVYANEVELFRERVRGGEPPITIRLELEAPRRITLAVEPGEEYDLADHVSWCDVRLLNLSDE